jgi:hypothetical protein
VHALPLLLSAVVSLVTSSGNIAIGSHIQAAAENCYRSLPFEDNAVFKPAVAINTEGAISNLRHIFLCEIFGRTKRFNCAPQISFLIRTNNEVDCLCRLADVRLIVYIHFWRKALTNFDLQSGASDVDRSWSIIFDDYSHAWIQCHLKQFFYLNIDTYIIKRIKQPWRHRFQIFDKQISPLNIPKSGFRNAEMLLAGLNGPAHMASMKQGDPPKPIGSDPQCQCEEGNEYRRDSSQPFGGYLGKQRNPLKDNTVFGGAFIIGGVIFFVLMAFGIRELIAGRDEDRYLISDSEEQKEYAKDERDPTESKSSAKPR